MVKKSGERADLKADHAQGNSAANRSTGTIGHSSGDIILSLENLRVSFSHGTKSRLIAVDDVSFDLKRGSTLGLVGESGCGKSVTSMALMRLLPQPSGKIEKGHAWFWPNTPLASPDKKGEPSTDKIDLLAYPKSLLHTIRGRRIAVIFQNALTALNPVHTIGAQIGEVFRLHFPELSRDEVRERSIDLLRRVDMPAAERRLKDFPFQLSGGMRQRVVIAMALACQPEILIADEPTTALDVTVQEQILKLIQELQQDHGMSVIFITHDLGVVAEMCDDVVVMYAGRVAERAYTKPLIQNPRHPYTRGLLNSLPSLAARPKSKLSVIPGTVPALVNMPSGCRFNNRCSLASDVCEQQPQLIKKGSHRWVACHEVAKEPDSD